MFRTDAAKIPQVDSHSSVFSLSSGSHVAHTAVPAIGTGQDLGIKITSQVPRVIAKGLWLRPKDSPGHFLQCN